MLVRLDHIVSGIVNADHSIMWTAAVHRVAGQRRLAVQGRWLQRGGKLVTRRNVTPSSLRDVREFNWIG
jgi:hypothetical protein